MNELISRLVQRLRVTVVAAVVLGGFAGRAAADVFVNDESLFVRSIRLTELWSVSNADHFAMSGYINPAGAVAVADLTGAVMTVQIYNPGITNQFSTLGVPLPLDAHGHSSVSTNGMKLTAMFRPTDGAYSFAVKGTDLRGLLGITNFTQLGFVTNVVSLKIDGAGLATPFAETAMDLPFATLKNHYTHGLFNFRTLPLLGAFGLFHAFHTTAEQQGTNFTVHLSSVLAIPLDSLIATNGPMTIYINNEAIVLNPARSDTSRVFRPHFARNSQLPVFNLSYNPQLGIIPLPFTSNTPAPVYEYPVSINFRTVPIPNTGIPPATNGAATTYSLPIAISLPTGFFNATNFSYTAITTNLTDCVTNIMDGVTNLMDCATTNIVSVGQNTNVLIEINDDFETTVELKRPSSASPKWSR